MTKKRTKTVWTHPHTNSLINTHQKTPKHTNKNKTTTPTTTPTTKTTTKKPTTSTTRNQKSTNPQVLALNVSSHNHHHPNLYTSLLLEVQKIV
ncbi:MAG: hypothetical protein LBH74_02050 [Nitrososphaerota archaeon]|jgi:hypothetical protein|nr:hypothetical protein [Nitrososphaerota archaeon]